MTLQRVFFAIIFIHSFSALGQEELTHFSSANFEKFRFAHRGGYTNGPENTIKTILGSINRGVNAIEIDVELTKDNQLVVFHDKTIDRILNTVDNKKVSDMKLSELQSIPLRDQTQGTQYVCSLNELIDTLTILIPRSEINDFILEIDFKPNGDKTEDGVKALNQIIEKHLTHFGDNLYNYFFISSFYPQVLKELKKNNPKIVTAFALHNAPEKSKLPAKLAILFAGRIIKKNNIRIIEPNICMISDRFVRKWLKRDILIITYTANTNCEKKYLDTFPLAYTTDCPLKTCESEKYRRRKKWCKKCNE